MLNEAKLSETFQREVIYIVVYILNREQLRVNSGKTPYEMCYGILTTIKHFKIFGSNCYIKSDDN